ncbi:MAG: DUF5671 domain-containing protein [Candidatus ainarchaeum sp.]|jgi:hypothetical protein|nr:DUF5671 domain-containing protein [Candidatus ainarchaeum sp.]
MKNKNPKFAFYYVLSLVALIFMSFSVGMIIFSIINKTIIDALSFSYIIDDSSSLRFGIAALIISAPIFFVCVKTINRNLKKGHMDKDGALRNWLTYFILAVSAIIILGSFVGVIYNFLEGETTLKSILQLVTVMVIAALVFSYYMYDIRRNEIKKKDWIINTFFIASLTIVLASFITSWFFMESPKMAHIRRIDDQLLNNINSVENYINNYYDLKNKLPDSLEQVANEVDIYHNYNIFFDPETKEEIEYHKLGEKEFELCANFRVDSYDYLSKKNIQIYDKYQFDNMKDYKQGWNCFKGSLWSAEKNDNLVD